MHVLPHHAAADAAGTIDPRGRAIALSVVFAAGALLLIMAPVIGASGTLGLLALLIAAFGAGWGFARAAQALSGAPGGDALGFPAVGGRLAAGAGGVVWRPGLAGAAPRRDVRQRGGGCRLARCRGTGGTVG